MDAVTVEDYIAFAPFFVDLHERIVASNPLSLDHNPVSVTPRRYSLRLDDWISTLRSSIASRASITGRTSIFSVGRESIAKRESLADARVLSSSSVSDNRASMIASDNAPLQAYTTVSGAAERNEHGSRRPTLVEGRMSLGYSGGHNDGGRVGKPSRKPSLTTRQGRASSISITEESEGEDKSKRNSATSSALESGVGRGSVIEHRRDSIVIGGMELREVDEDTGASRPPSIAQL